MGLFGSYRENTTDATNVNEQSVSEKNTSEKNTSEINTLKYYNISHLAKMLVAAQKKQDLASKLISTISLRSEKHVSVIYGPNNERCLPISDVLEQILAGIKIKIKIDSKKGKCSISDNYIIASCKYLEIKVGRNKQSCLDINSIKYVRVKSQKDAERLTIKGEIVYQHVKEAETNIRLDEYKERSIIAKMILKQQNRGNLAHAVGHQSQLAVFNGPNNEECVPIADKLHKFLLNKYAELAILDNKNECIISDGYLVMHLDIININYGVGPHPCIDFSNIKYFGLESDKNKDYWSKRRSDMANELSRIEQESTREQRQREFNLKQIESRQQAERAANIERQRQQDEERRKEIEEEKRKAKIEAEKDKQVHCIEMFDYKHKFRHRYGDGVRLPDERKQLWLLGCPECGALWIGQWIMDGFCFRLYREDRQHTNNICWHSHYNFRPIPLVDFNNNYKKKYGKPWKSYRNGEEY